MSTPNKTPVPDSPKGVNPEPDFEKNTSSSGGEKKKTKMSHISSSAVVEVELATIEQAMLALLETKELRGEQDITLLDDFILGNNDEESFDDYDLLDPPDDEINIETGEIEVSAQTGELGSGESFIEFAWRQFYEQFMGGDDEIINIITDYLKSWEYPYYPLEVNNLLIKQEHSFLKEWFESLRYEYGGVIQKLQTEETHVSPDIIFSVNDGIISYEICMGILERFIISQSCTDRIVLKYCKDKGDKSKINKYPVPVNNLFNLLDQRRSALSLLADFLMEEQQHFLISSTILGALSTIKSIKQNEFLAYLKRIGVIKTSEKASSGAGTVSRIVNSKFIKFPFYYEPLPASFCFDKLVRNQKQIEIQQKVMEKTFDLLLDKYPGKTLSGTDQAIIISDVLGIKYSSESVSNTLWGHLQKGKYANRKELWPLLKMTNKDENGKDLPKRIPNNIKLSKSELNDLIEEVKRQIDVS